MSDVTIGVDSGTARLQAVTQRAATACPVQNKLLRRLFWLRTWSAQRLVLFRVPSALNPADPMSRANSFPRFPQAMREADFRRLRWENSNQPYQAYQETIPQVKLEHMTNVEPSFVLYALLLDPGCCLRAHIILIKLVEPGGKKRIATSRMKRSRILILHHGRCGPVHNGAACALMTVRRHPIITSARAGEWAPSEIASGCGGRSAAEGAASGAGATRRNPTFNTSSNSVSTAPCAPCTHIRSPGFRVE